METKEVVTAVTVRGVDLWKSVEGNKVLWQQRLDGEIGPSAWRLWYQTAREASAEFGLIGTGRGCE